MNKSNRDELSASSTPWVSGWHRGSKPSRHGELMYRYPAGKCIARRADGSSSAVRA